MTRPQGMEHEMFPLDILAQAVPAYRLAGRFGVDALGLLWPSRQRDTDEGIRVFALAGLAHSFDPEALFHQEHPLQVSRAALRDHVLLAHPRGEFFSTDRLALSQLRVHSDGWLIDFSITHFEDPNGEPAPRELYVVLSVELGDSRPQSLSLQFSGRWRNFQGEETPMAQPAAPPLRIEFSD